MASLTWNSDTVTTEADLRKAMTDAVGVKKGKTLIDSKFTKDHIFAGHGGSVEKLAGVLANLRERPLSTLLTGSMDTTSQAEVKNWITKVPFTGLTYASGVWTLATMGTAVDGVNTYDFATVDYDVYKITNRDDKIKKARHWLTLSKSKAVKVACRFTSATDCTPVIYHLDF